jgi:hypothetical protein
MVLIELAVVVAIILLLRFLYYVSRTDADQEQEAGGGGDRVGQPPPLQQQLESNEAGGGWVVDGAPASTAAGTAMEMAPPLQAAEPPLVCTYGKADGWREGSCGVCLADLDDGEAVRVLPACLHYFHAVCVGEWLRIHATCPLCRAPLIAPTDAI